MNRPRRHNDGERLPTELHGRTSGRTRLLGPGGKRLEPDSLPPETPAPGCTGRGRRGISPSSATVDTPGPQNRVRTRRSWRSGTGGAGMSGAAAR